MLASTTASTPPPANATSPAPYMRCVNDFWGNCTGVASNRHDYRWRYVRPGARPKELRESATARASMGGKAAVRETAVLRNAPPVRETVAAHSSPAVRDKAPAREKVVHDTAVTTRDGTMVCHARRRVVGDERASRDDARRAAEYGWMGSVRYDYGERYQDMNRAKDVRFTCGPSSVSAALKTPHFRCAVEATPCRETKGYQTGPDERRMDPPAPEDRISRK
ncbi:MAG: hypothetical protein K2X43_12170 [Hyphomonadaceae bacterium]|nr:hypothetical protein [Hyphomonadaceae bacterium]